jgi:uncharacterized membrane protein YfhO
MPRESAPRVSWVPCAYFVADGEAAWEMVFSSEVNFNAEVILEKASPSQDRNCFASVGIAEILEEQPNRIEIKTESRSVGWLVLSDVWYPGWQAEIDEVPTPILRANYLFRAVEVPTGEHIVTFVYRPLWYAAGLAISVLTCLGLLLMLIVYRIGSRK